MVLSGWAQQNSCRQPWSRMGCSLVDSSGRSFGLKEFPLLLSWASQTDVGLQRIRNPGFGRELGLKKQSAHRQLCRQWW